MTRAADPFYSRKPVSDALIKDVGLTGLTSEQEFLNRERKYSADNGVDVRRFSNSKSSGWEPSDDPYYGRRRVSKAEITNVGDSGLTPDQEHQNRERKFSATGVDVRRFSTSRKGGLEPQDDPYYSRKRVSKAEIHGVGDSGMTPAEQFEVRERKLSLFQLSDDPFDQVAGRHRGSVSGVASGASNAATQRRRSSAVAPDVEPSHSGYHGESLAPIESRPEPPPVEFVEPGFSESSPRSTTTTLHNKDVAGSTSAVLPVATSSTSNKISRGEHSLYHDAVTNGNHHDHDGPESVAPRLAV